MKKTDFLFVYICLIKFKTSMFIKFATGYKVELAQIEALKQHQIELLT